MEIKGFIGVSLSDWDGKVSSVIFLPNCNFRCPFCYNVHLVLQPSRMPTIPRDKILRYLDDNRGWIDGVVITGGEPTLHSDLPTLCRDLKKADLHVKLDTNGTNPKMVTELVNENLVDYVAMDLKAPLTVTHYSKASGVDATAWLPNIEQTLQTLLDGKADYEFRTTLVPTLHTNTDLAQICEKVKDCRKYALQAFRADVETIDPGYQSLKPSSKAQLESFFETARRIVPNTMLRI